MLLSSKDNNFKGDKCDSIHRRCIYRMPLFALASFMISNQSLYTMSPDMEKAEMGWTNAEIFDTLWLRYAAKLLQRKETSGIRLKMLLTCEVSCPDAWLRQFHFSINTLITIYLSYHMISTEKWKFCQISLCFWGQLQAVTEDVFIFAVLVCSAH